VVAQEQELAAGGSRGGSGDGGAMWRGRSRPAQGREGGGQGVGGHVAQLRAARGQWVHGTWPAKRRWCVRQRNRGGGVEVDEGGSVCNFPKVQGLHCKAKITFKP
jgi:hypothetical protein